MSIIDKHNKGQETTCEKLFIHKYLEVCGKICMMNILIGYLWWTSCWVNELPGDYDKE